MGGAAAACRAFAGQRKSRSVNYTVRCTHCAAQAPPRAHQPLLRSPAASPLIVRWIALRERTSVAPAR